VPLDERELLEAPHVQEGGRVRRVEDLVAGRGELAQEPVQVPLGLRPEIELRLLDQKHEPTHAGSAPAFDGLDEGDRRAGRRPSGGAGVEGADEELRRLRRDPVSTLGPLDEGACALRTAQEEDGEARPASPRRLRWGGIQRDLLSGAEVRGDPDRALATDRDVLRRRCRGVRVEQSPDCSQHVGLADVRLADKRAERPRSEGELLSRPEARDADLSQPEACRGWCGILGRRYRLIHSRN
jgi:hypothetical protein